MGANLACVFGRPVSAVPENLWFKHQAKPAHLLGRKLSLPFRLFLFHPFPALHGRGAACGG